MASPKPKQDFDPWLRKQINSRKYPGVVWTIPDTEFSISWKHGNRDDLKTVDVKIYKAWADKCDEDTAGGKGTDEKKKYIVWKREFNKALRVFKEVSHYRVFRWPAVNPNPKPPKPDISWVKERIGHPDYPGVVWTNPPECTEFSIPWKQGKYSIIFEDWSKVGLGPKGQASGNSYWKNRFHCYLKDNGFKTLSEERVFRWPGQGGSQRIKVEEGSGGASGEEDSSCASGGEEDSSGASGGEEESVEGLEKGMAKLEIPKKEEP